MSLIVRVELHSAITGKVAEIARMRIANDGDASRADPRLGDYEGVTFFGRRSGTLDRGQVQRKGQVRGWRRHERHVWNLVAVMLAAIGYGDGKSREP